MDVGQSQTQTGSFRPGRMPRAQNDQRRQSPEDGKAGQRTGYKPQSQTPVGTGCHCQQGQPRGEHPDSGPGPFSRRHAQSVDIAPEQGRRRHTPCDSQRFEGKHQGDQQPEQRRTEQRDGIEPRTQRQRHDFSRQPHGNPGNGRTGRQPGGGPQSTEDQHLQQIGGEDHAATGADALHDGDMKHLAVEIAPHRTCYADAAHQQGAQSDQSQIESHALDHHAHPWGGFLPAPQTPAGIWEALLERAFQIFDIGFGGETQAVGIGHQAARLQQAGGIKSRTTHQQPRSQGEGLNGAIRLMSQHAANAKRGIAEKDLLTHLYVKAFQQRPFRQRPEPPVSALCERRRQLQRRLGSHPPV